MISYLKGSIRQKVGRMVVVDVNSVGYQVFCTAPLMARLEIDQESEIVTHTDVQETSIKLYGFHDHLELQVFSLLIAVNGIGAKSAVDILSGIDKLDLLKSLNAADLAQLKKIKGVGAKTAERLILELKDKVKDLISDLDCSAADATSNSNKEAEQALLALGFNQKTVDQAMKKIADQIEVIKDSGEIVRLALANI